MLQAPISRWESVGFFDTARDCQGLWSSMTNGISHIWELLQKFYWKRVATDWRRANHYLRQTDALYTRLIREADRKNDEEASRILYGEWQADREQEQYEVDKLQTIYSRKLAAKYRVPEPPDGEVFWKRYSYRGGVHLTVAGIDFIEARVYEKWKRRWEFWLLFATAATGVIGAATGLFAVLHHISG